MQWLDLRHFEKRLEQRRAALAEQLRLAEAEEQFSETDSLEAILRQAARAQVAEIKAALQRIRLGLFGICQRCGELLPPQRLEGAPWARHCFPCQTLRLGIHADLVPYQTAGKLGYGSKS